VKLDLRRRHVKEPPERTWLELATDWKLWVLTALCLLVATIAWLLGYE
jgi:hypothetical protein